MANYSVLIDGEFFCKTKADHVESVVYDLESQGLSIVDETWNDDDRTVELTTAPEVRIVERDAKQWPGDGIGVHRLDPDERDLEDARDVAARDGFETIYVYRTRGLRLIK